MIYSESYLVPMRYVTAIKLRNTLVPKLQLGNPDEALASRDGKLELPILNSQAGAWEPALTKILNLMAVTRCVGTHQGRVASCTDTDVGRNKTARRQPGRAFPAIGAPETPVLRLTRGQAYSGLRRDVYNNERSAWEREKI